MTTSLRLLDLQNITNDIYINNSNFDIIKNQNKFDVIKHKVGQIYDVYSRYINTGELDDILQGTTKSVLQYIGAQTDLYYDNTPFAFSHTKSSDISEIMRQNEVLRSNIYDQNIIRSAYVDIASKQTYNRYSSHHLKPEGLQYFYCNWKIVYGDIKKLNNSLDPITAFSDDADNIQFPISILKVIPTPPPSFTSIVDEPFIKHRFTMRFNMGLILSFYLKMSSDVNLDSNSGLVLIVNNSDKNLMVYETMLLYKDYADGMRKYSIKLPSYIVQTNDSSTNQYNMQLILKFKSKHIVTHITALDCISKVGINYDPGDVKQQQFIIDNSIQNQV